MKSIWIHDLYIAKRDENLATFLKGKFGWTESNPGPLIEYPPNAPFFTPSHTGTIKAGDRFAIPWSKQRLHRQIRIDQKYVEDRKRAAQRSLHLLGQFKQEADSTTLLCDAIGSAALISIGGMIEAYKITKSLDTAKKGTDAAKAVEASRKALSLTTLQSAGGRGLVTIATLDTSQFTTPDSMWSHLVRHAAGPLTPSWWASMAAGAIETDADLFLQGTGAIHKREARRVLQQLEKDVGSEIVRITAMKRQAAMPFYDARVTIADTSPVATAVQTRHQ